MSETHTDPHSPEVAAEAGTSDARRWELIGTSSSGEQFPAIRIGENPLQIGRDPHADIVIPQKVVSKAHAEVFAVGPTVFVRDLKSTNGTYLNRRRVRKLSPVRDGDQIQIGSIVFEIESKEDSDRSTGASAGDTVVSPTNWMAECLDELVEDGNVYMVFQPVVRAESQQVFAFEALVRSRLENAESATELFRLAGQMQVSKKLSHLCRMMAAREAAKLPDAPPIFTKISDREQLDESLLASLQEVREQFPNVRLVVEVNEVCLQTAPRMDRFEEEVSRLEFGISYDNFGSGQTRPQDLPSIRPGFLKFSRSLTADLESGDPSVRNRLKAQIEAAHAVGIATIVKEVECPTTLDVCRDLGVDFCVGFETGVPAIPDQWQNGVNPLRRTIEDVAALQQ